MLDYDRLQEIQEYHEQKHKRKIEGQRKKKSGLKGVNHFVVV